MLTPYSPCLKTSISQEFGCDNSNHPERRNFYNIFDNKHPGVDFDLPIGTEVLASFSGVVVRKETHSGMGKVIAVRNGNIVALYAHLKKFNVKFGEVVKTKHLIGYSGNTGSACLEPHLHFELRNISKNTLPEMVFKPIFNKQIKQHEDSFIYKVNNKNTKKSLFSLSKLFFGDGNCWRVIQIHNPCLAKYRATQLLLEGTELIIPNF